MWNFCNFLSILFVSEIVFDTSHRSNISNQNYFRYRLPIRHMAKWLYVSTDTFRFCSSANDRHIQFLHCIALPSNPFHSFILIPYAFLISHSKAIWSTRLLQLFHGSNTKTIQFESLLWWWLTGTRLFGVFLENRVVLPRMPWITNEKHHFIYSQILLVWMGLVTCTPSHRILLFSSTHRHTFPQLNGRPQWMTK